jgi:hypothetical protein
MVKYQPRLWRGGCATTVPKTLDYHNFTMFARQRVKIVEGSLTQEGHTLLSLLLVCQCVRHLTHTFFWRTILIRFGLFMVGIIVDPLY